MVTEYRSRLLGDVGDECARRVGLGRAQHRARSCRGAAVRRTESSSAMLQEKSHRFV